MNGYISKCFTATVFAYLGLACLFCGNTKAESRVTLIGKGVAFEFNRFGLGADNFLGSDITGMDRRTEISLLESINDSLLIMFGKKNSAESYDAIFSRPEISKAIDNLLSRGGMICFNNLNYNSVNTFPDSMRNFFEQHNAFLPEAENYSRTPGKRAYRAFANPRFSKIACLSQPNNLSYKKWVNGAEATSFWEKYPTCMIPLLIESKTPYRTCTLMQPNVSGKGYIIYNLSYSVARSGRSKFFQNVIKLLYGKTETGVADVQRCKSLRDYTAG